MKFCLKDLITKHKVKIRIVRSLANKYPFSGLYYKSFTIIINLRFVAYLTIVIYDPTMLKSKASFI
jgi:hypothetical protein